MTIEHKVKETDITIRVGHLKDLGFKFIHYGRGLIYYHNEIKPRYMSDNKAYGSNDYVHLSLKLW